MTCRVVIALTVSGNEPFDYALDTICTNYKVWSEFCRSFGKVNL